MDRSSGCSLFRLYGALAIGAAVGLIGSAGIAFAQPTEQPTEQQSEQPGGQPSERIAREPPTAAMSGAVEEEGAVTGSGETGVMREPPAADMERPAEPVETQTRSLFVGPLRGHPRGPCLRGEVCYDLTIGYTEGELYNPATDSYDKVRLRAYLGRVEDEQGQIPFVAPVVDIRPGRTFRLTLHNDLPTKEEMELPGPPNVPGDDVRRCVGEVKDPNIPNCAAFNETNMHTHGLWVSPVGNGDNVLLTINPQVDFTYEYNIPPDHPAGTFWYHAHRHGSTAPQVSSGMAGALIIRGDRLPVRGADGEWAEPGDVDVLLPRWRRPFARGEVFRDRIMVLQQIAYACRDKATGAIKTNEDGSWRCDEGDVGTVEPGPNNAFDQLTPASWGQSGRYTAINGEVAPRLPDAVAGQVERWRLIHGGVRNSVKLRLRKQSAATREEGAAAFSYRQIAPDRRAQFVTDNCSGDPLPVLGLATDGLTRPTLDKRTDTWLQPGYREDLLVSFPEPGWYCLINGRVEDDEAINGEGTESVLIGRIYVAPARRKLDDTSPTQRIVDALVSSARTNLPPDTRDRVIADLRDGGRLAAFVKHRPIADDELTGSQSLAFRIFDADPDPASVRAAFEIGELGENFGGGFVIQNSASYDAAVINRTLMLNGADEWILTSLGGGGHPFHIHVNPFQIIEVLQMVPDDLHPNIDPNDRSTWVDVSGPGDPNQSQYANLKGTWKDTLFTMQGHLIRFRTRYQRYIGEFVLHCHILDHEDQGMMQNIRIAIPDGQGGLTATHH